MTKSIETSGTMKFIDICEYLNKLQTNKGQSYGLMDNGEQESWNKEGEIGAYFTVKRKLDRLEKAIKDAMRNGHLNSDLTISDAGRTGEPLIETIADAAVYFTKWIQWYANHVDPEGFKVWVETNKLFNDLTIRKTPLIGNPYMFVEEDSSASL